MAQNIFRLARQAGRARSQLLALSGASAAAAYLGFSDAMQETSGVQRLNLPRLLPVALAESATEAQGSPVGVPPRKTGTAKIALTGFEDVKDVNGFVTAALDKALKYQKNSPLQSMVATKPAAPLPPADAPLSPAASRGEQGPVPTVDPAAFYAQLEKQPLSEKIIVLDDIVDSVIREAERSAEVSALTVGMVAGGAACYALLGVWGDMALPGVGTVACSAVAGAAGHNRAKAAAKRTRTRFLNAILSEGGATGRRNAFVDYLAAPSIDVKQRIAGSTPPAAFFADFYTAVAPLLHQSKEAADLAGMATIVVFN